MPSPKLPPVPGLEGLGFELEEKLEKFLADSGHQPLQEKSDQVFPPTAAPRFTSMPGSDIANDFNDEGLAMSDDKELDLISDDGLSLGESGDSGESLSSDDGLVLDDFGSLDDLNTESVDGLSLAEDFSLSDETAPENTMTGLRLGDDIDLGDDVLDKLKEIDAIMEKDATMSRPLPDIGEDDLDEGLSFASIGEESSPEISPAEESSLSAGLGLDVAESMMESGELSFVSEEEVEAPIPPVLAKPNRTATSPATAPQVDYAEASGHYSSELERLQATLNHLRADRAELVKKLDEVDDERVHHQRQLLNLRAELDDKKIENQLLRKRSTDEVQQLQSRAKLEEERRLLAEEKVKALQSELTGLQQKMKMEVRKVGGRERELEQQLELLKSDASTQIRHRDMKILELKRRLDAMEFEVENVSSLEKKAVGDRQELEGKLDKAIRTLRSAIGVLEQEDPRLASLEKLKNNLDV